MYEQVDAFIEFFMEHKSTDFGARDERTDSVYGFGRHDLYDYEDDLNTCELCGYDYGVEIYGHRVCKGCFDYMYNKVSLDTEFGNVVGKQTEYELLN